MTLVTSILTQAQIDELRALRQTALALPEDAVGAWFPVYDKLYEFITTPGTVYDSPVTGVDHNVWLWVRGARLINLDVGPQAHLIRQYTAIEYKLHYGVDMTAADLNLASNRIARQFFEEWIPTILGQQASAIVPDINKTGERDAGPMAATIFNGDHAPWAGTILFANLGAPQFYRNWVLTALDNPNAPADPEKTLETGSYDIVSIAQSIQDYSSLESISTDLYTYFKDIFGTYGNVLGYHATVTAIAAEADAKFKTAYSLGVGDPNVKIGNDTFGFWNVASNVGKSAHYAVGTRGDDVIGYSPAANGSYATSRLNYLIGQLGGDVVNAGRGNDTVYGTDGSDILDGGENTDTLTYILGDKTFLSSYKLSFDAKGVFGPRIVVDKFDPLSVLFGANRDIAVNFEQLTLDFRSQQVANSGSPSSFAEQLMTNPDALVATITWDSGGQLGDVLYRSETVQVSGSTAGMGSGGTRILIDGGEEAEGGAQGGGGQAPASAPTGDKLDFSGFSGPVYIDYARMNLVTDFLGLTSAPYAVEMYASYSPVLQWGQWIWNLLVPSSEPAGQGLYNGTGIRFTNFEHVIGSANDDIMSLYRLSPGGELTAEQAQALKAAQNVSVPLNGAPVEIGAALDGAMEQARLIPQNQQDVIIEGGAGNDTIWGTATGVDSIYGGAGIDKLYAGGFTSKVHGGDDTDYVAGGGFKSQLYGEGGADLFSLSNNTVVMDATTDDFVTWNGFRLTGGVQQWWQEAGWAYWAPFTPLVSMAPLSFLNVFGAIAVTLDMAAMASFRYTVAGDQLVVQFARGRGGQAVIENYELDLDDATATGHVVAFRQVLQDPRNATLDDFKRYVCLVMAQGFGRTDPLVLDLDGDGLELMRQGAGETWFDIDGDGFAERTGWVKGDDGFLARDLNSNGAIDDISELFGNAATPGLTALAALDSNTDGKISAADSEFGTLRIWRDLKETASPMKGS